MAVTSSILSGVTINEIGGSPNIIQDLNGDGFGTNDDQFIELVNTSGSTVDISGWQLYERDVVKHTFVSGTTLAAGERITIVDSANTTNSIVGGIGQAVYSDVPIGPSALDVFALYSSTTNEYIVLEGTMAQAVPQTLIDTVDEVLADHPGATQVGTTEEFRSTGSGESNQRQGDGEDSWTEATATAGGANASCFAPGTLISTPSGAQLVEELEPGDMVLTADGRAVPVRFNLCQSAAKRAVMPERFEPVRIEAGALGDGLPLRDLVITGDHGMILDGLVINAGALVNGGSIAWVPFAEMPDPVVYYHIETDAHDVILAEGAPAETFIDVAGRQVFDNYQGYIDLYGAERIIPEMDRPRISSQRLVPDAIKARLGIGVAAFGIEDMLRA